MRLGDVGASVATRLLGVSGTTWTYSRGNTTDSIDFIKTDNRPLLMDSGNGLVTEVQMVTFRGLMTDVAALFTEPEQGDRLTDGTSYYEVNPVADKCFYVVGGMVHVWAKKVAA